MGICNSRLEIGKMLTGSGVISLGKSGPLAQLNQISAHILLFICIAFSIRNPYNRRTFSRITQNEHTRLIAL